MKKDLTDIQTLSRTEAVKAFCYDCCTGMVDKAYMDCEIRGCPFYAYQPYRKLKPDLSWVNDGRFMWALHDSYNPDSKLDKKGRPRRVVACSAKCYDCMAGLREDCAIVNCPIYKWQKYRKLEIDTQWRIAGLHIQKNRVKLQEYYSSKYYAKRRQARMLEAGRKNRPNAEYTEGEWTNVDGWENTNA